MPSRAHGLFGKPIQAVSSIICKPSSSGNERFVAEQLQASEKYSFKHLQSITKVIIPTDDIFNNSDGPKLL